MNPLIEVLCNEITKIKKALTTTGSDYTATVTKVEGDTAYVQMSGSDISDTPVALSVNADVGDHVRVRVANGKAWITGNDTLPPSNDKKEVGTKMMKDMSDRDDDILIDFGKMEFRGNTLVVDSDNFKLDEDGNAKFGGDLEAAGGTFKGNLSAAGGTFSGNLNAAGGTFAGNLSAAGGTFSGNLSAAGGTFSGNLSAAGGTFAGNLSAAGGTFAGSLSAATGTFAGSLSAASGTFSGNLSAASGSFKGSLVFPWASSVTRNIYINDTSKGAPFVIIGVGEGGLGALETTIESGYIEVSQAYQDKYAVLSPTGVQTFSDARLKKDIKAINPEIAKHLRPVQFRFKNSEDTEYGFIAQEVQKIIPAAVNKGLSNDYLTLNYQELIAPLYALVQEQEDRINQLEARLKALEEKK